MAPIIATECPECGRVFPLPEEEEPRGGAGTEVPDTAPGQLVRVDENQDLRCTTKGGSRRYRDLKRWINEPESYAERYRRARLVALANGYSRGWCRHVLEDDDDDLC